LTHKYYPYNLKFQYPFTISRGTKTHQPTLIVSLDQFGHIGYGEARTITYTITVDPMVQDIEGKHSGRN
jgi:L-alanine-DL-glutamate epimerase-like enolase superfamily enzyme